MLLTRLGVVHRGSRCIQAGTPDTPTDPFRYSTVTLLARLRGLSTSVPRASAVW